MNTSWLFVFLCADVGLFLLYKTARKDFNYFLNLDGVVRFVVSFVTRLGQKIMVDFTLMIQLRRPQVAGGVSFMSSILVSVAASVGSVCLYSYHYHIEGDEKKWKKKLCWPCSSACVRHG